MQVTSQPCFVSCRLTAASIDRQHHPLLASRYRCLVIKFVDTRGNPEEQSPRRGHTLSSYGSHRTSITVGYFS
ncbi:hypothetical protein Peur_019466 [Populus x canadensis]